MATLSQELGYLARKQLSVLLDHESPQGRDWMGLADCMHFTYSTVLALKGQRSPTLALLEQWEKVAGSGATMTTLANLLDSLHCKEAVSILERERAKVTARREAGRSVVTTKGVVDTSSSLTGDVHCMRDSDSSPARGEREALGGNEISRGGSETSSLEASVRHVCSQRYDVFLSYAEEDKEFAEEMRSRLVGQAKLRVFVPSDGLMPGKVFHEEIADMIKRGCRKTVVVLSPDYVESPWCKYEANLAIMASPDAAKHVLIPVLYRKCEIPAFLRPLYYSDYPRHQGNRDDCERYFWQKLYKSLNYVPRERHTRDHH